MRSLLIFLWKFAKKTMGIVFAIIALRRILMDLDELIQKAKSKISGEYVPHHDRARRERELDELARPLEPGGLPLGIRSDWKPWMSVSKKCLSLSARARKAKPNLLIVGSPGMGATKYLSNLIKADIESGDRAVVIIDSDGYLVDLLQRWMSADSRKVEFAKRTVLLDPTNTATATYNPFNGNVTRHQEVASALTHMMTAIHQEPPGAQSQWNAQTANIFHNGILLLLASDKSLSDFPLLVSDNDFRDTLLDAVTIKNKASNQYAVLIDTWSQYKRLARTDQWIVWVEPILNRLSPALSDPRVRSILLAEKNSLNLDDVIERKQILLVKLESSKLDSSANLLGGMIALGLKTAADLREGSAVKVPVVLHLSNLDKFLREGAFNAITDIGKTSNCWLEVIGTVSSLGSLSEVFRDQLLAKCGTLVGFAASQRDATLLAPLFFRFNAKSPPESAEHERKCLDKLMHLPEREFYCYRAGTATGAFLLRMD